VLIIGTISLFAKDLNLHYGTRLQSSRAAFVFYLESKARCIRSLLVQAERVAQLMNLELDSSQRSTTSQAGSACGLFSLPASSAYA
jgi:hypothetical protein